MTANIECKDRSDRPTTQCSALFEASMLCHLARWARCHWTTHWHFVSFIQNILHNISHTHLLTVPNTVGSVSSLRVAGCQAVISPRSTVFFFWLYLCLESISPVSLMPSCPQRRTLIFLTHFSLSHNGAPPVASVPACCSLIFESDKVTH